jgi:hypothetical protein
MPPAGLGASVNLMTFLPRASRLALLALTTLLFVSITLPGPSAAQVGDCDADPVVCAEIIQDDCFNYPFPGCFVDPVPMCVYWELHPPAPLPGWGAGIYCWLS